MSKKSQKERIAELHGQLADKCKEIASLRKGRLEAANAMDNLIEAAQNTGVDERILNRARAQAICLRN